jgi:hypothetical protein
MKRIWVISLLTAMIVVLSACTSTEYKKQMEYGKQALADKKYEDAITAFSAAVKEKPDATEAVEILTEAEKMLVKSKVEAAIAESKTAIGINKFIEAETILLSTKDIYKSNPSNKEQLQLLDNMLSLVKIKKSIFDGMTAISGSKLDEAEVILADVQSQKGILTDDKKKIEELLATIKARKNLAAAEKASTLNQYGEAFQLLIATTNETKEIYDEALKSDISIALEEVNSKIHTSIVEAIQNERYDDALSLIAVILTADSNDTDAIKLQNEVKQLIEAEKAKQVLTDYISAYSKSISDASSAMNENNSSIIESRYSQMLQTPVPSNDFDDLATYWKHSLQAMYSVTSLKGQIASSKSTEALNKALTGRSSNKSYINEYSNITEQVKIALENISNGEKEVKRLKAKYNL